ncbi:MAG: hypothetical protein JWP89_1153 [Schlesneria sp.]|nr:hypothetical protein [Schlesneria sp.]
MRIDLSGVGGGMVDRGDLAVKGKEHAGDLRSGRHFELSSNLNSLGGRWSR